MEEDGEETPRTPFWIQSTTNVRRVDLYRRRASSLFFNSGVLIIFLLSLAILCMVFIIPSLISFTSHIFKPNLVKKSWDSINLVLVLFALAFGFLSRNINKDNDLNTNTPRFENGFERTRSDLSTGPPVSSPVISTPHQWYDFPDQPIVGLRRHRSTSSYPDLRELSPPWNHRRFSDDTHLKYDRYYFRQDQDHIDTTMDLPKEESHAPPPQPPSPPHIPPEPPATGKKEKPIQTYHSVAADPEEKVSSLEVEEVSSFKVNNVILPEKETELPVKETELPEKETELPEKETEQPDTQNSGKMEETLARKRGKGARRRARSSEPRKMVSPENEPAPELSSYSPPLILPEIQEFEMKHQKLERKKSGNATKEFFTSFYNKKKKKRQRQRSVDNLDNLLHHSQSPERLHHPPPPPPPPPPPSLLNNLFSSKKERRKKTSSTPPLPPPLPPPYTATRAPRPTTTRVSPFVTEKPRVPIKMNFFNSIDDSSSGGESPMNRIPPPPPMPPFKMPDWKFPVEGDYVRVQSTLNSDSGSPEGDESQSPSSAVASPLFCPSPDVDTKADTFIARFRAGLKLEKMHSFNANQSKRMSNLGPGPGPSQSNRF
ncbi:uncharacterized protein [Rutidosis leptorrhynchoides]|uniref:uncharacterized protein n=1 Tax=Rutidosis leptorrhynchoides TaxID=125765 RepID=UPI003A9A230D